MRNLIKYLAAGIFLIVASTANAQTTSAPKPAILVADSILLNGNKILVAQGNVEALFDNIRLKASKIVYDRRTNSLSIEGPITIQDGDDLLILAASAELDSHLENGLLLGARMVMNQQLQLAAQQINRINGRYSQLYKAAVTSCRVCNSTQAPLWQIRAQRVVHDQIERQLYFDRAQFLIRDVPVFYLPRLRLPDPTLARATGFLIPSIRRNSLLGTGVKIPYFLRFGDHKDLTIIPYLSSETRTVEFKYRQALRHGRIFINGAVSQDTLLSGQTRGYIFAGGQFDLGRGFTLDFDVEAANDDAYLADYKYSTKDRLDSEISITRVRRDEYLRAALTQYHSLRVTENNSTLPTLIGDLSFERRFFPKGIGGELRLGAAGHTHYRYSNLTTDGADSDIWADGRDVARLNAHASWQNTWTLAGGIRATALTSLAVDSYRIAQIGGTADASATNITPAAAVILRWPFRKTTQSGARHVVEPMLQLAWVGGNNPNIPNDESTRVEFDEGNFLSLSRFPSVDRYERGASVAIGASWTRYDPTGWQTGLTIGQIIRETGHSDFSLSSGLGGARSDLLVAGHFKNKNGLSLNARGLLNSGFGVSKAEARASWKNNKMGLAASYVWLGADTMEDRANTVSEWSIDGSYRLSRHWTGTANVRYDVASNTTAQAGIGLLYRNECVDISLSASRRFTSSIILTPSTDFGFTVGLRGFSTKTSDKSYTRTCSK